MNNEKTIRVLNSLVQINNDRIEGYERASEETTEQELKSLFAEMSQTSQHCNQELTGEIRKLQGIPTDSTKTTGKFFRVWMDVKAALTGKDRKAILHSCEYGEKWATDTYEKALKDDSEQLSNEQQAMIKTQYDKLKADQDKVKSLHDALAEVV